jgi:hypothetical protein
VSARSSGTARPRCTTSQSTARTVRRTRMSRHVSRAARAGGAHGNERTLRGSGKYRVRWILAIGIGARCTCSGTRISRRPSAGTYLAVGAAGHGTADDGFGARVEQ